jgi:transposase
MRDTPEIFGVDVAKSELVIVRHGCAARAQSIPNTVEAIERWLAEVPPGSVVAMESTGRYGRLLAEAAHATGFRVYVLNAADVHHYARALGARGKTDRLDAEVIARYVAEHGERLRVWAPGVGPERRLQELLKRRWVLTQQRVVLRQSLAEVPELAATAQQLQQAYARALEELDVQLQTLVERDERLATDVARLRTVTGFGLQCSVLLAALFRRLGFDNADAVVAYSGLDPRPNDSGTKRGVRRLSKRGPGQLRRQLYLAAFAASRSHALGPLYQSIRARGFSTTEALVILARKLLRVAFAVYKRGEPFDPARLQPKVA